MTIRSYLTHILKLFGRQLVPNIGSVLIMTAMLFAYNAQAATLREPSGPANPIVSATIISYQGTLFDSSGNPVTGNVGMTFRFYSALTGGTKLWEEAHTGANAVPINNGLFHVLLGGLTPIPTSVWSSASVYLGILIAGETTELSPRELVGAVPYAMQASSAITADGSITTAKIADGAVTSEKIAVTAWNIYDPVQLEWETTVTNQYVEVTPLNFTYTPQVDGMMILDLSLTYYNLGGNGTVFCAIYVGGQDIAKSATLYSGSWESCATNVSYPVQAGQTYYFSVQVYKDMTGTLRVVKNSFTHLSATFLGTP